MRRDGGVCYRSRKCDTTFRGESQGEFLMEIPCRLWTAVVRKEIKRTFCAHLLNNIIRVHRRSPLRLH